MQRANERVRSAWNRTPARSSPCVASPAAPSTTIATTLRRVRAWRRRLVALFAFVALFYAVTIAKIGGNIASGAGG